MALPQAFTDKIRSTSWPRSRYPTTMPNIKRRLASGPFAETDAPLSPTGQEDRYAGYVAAALGYRWLD